MQVHALDGKRKRLLIGLLIVLFGGLLSVQPAGAASAQPFLSAASPVGSTVLGTVRLAPPAGLSASIASWVAALSAQKPFAAWKNAKANVEALGPGTHGWLVTLTDAQGKSVGYLIAYAAKDGTYRLGEYGVGPQPLFNRTALTHTLVENGLLTDAHNPYQVEKSYVHPFAAVWVVRIGSETYWADAKTTELLPLDETLWSKVANALPASTGKNEAQSASLVQRLQLGEWFDPYERLPWLSGVQPLGQRNDTELTDRLDQLAHMRYVSEPFGDRMLYALPAVGYLKWQSGRIDIALGMSGTRFIPLETLREFGLFYP
jgi:hypothetical protein